MNKKLLTTLTIATLLFTACGSDSKSSSESVESKIKKKDFIVIVQHQDECSVPEIKKEIVAISNFLTVPKAINSDTLMSISEKTSVTCEKYGRTYDDITCEIWDMEKATEKSCILGFDFQK